MRKIKNLKTEELLEYKKEQEEKINSVRHEYLVLQDQILSLANVIKKIDEVLDERTLTMDNIFELLNKFPETAARRKLLKQYLESIGLNDGGSYWAENNQSVIRIILYRDNDEITSKAYDGILKVLPFVKPIKNGYKMFDIFEHTLSYHHSYYLAYHEDTKIFSIITERDSIIYKNEDLREVLNYIQKYLYYEKTYS